MKKTLALVRGKLSTINFSAVKKLVPRSRKSISLSIIAMLVIVVAGSVFLAVIRPSQKQSKSMEAVSSLKTLESKQGSTCQDIVDSVGNTSANDVKSDDDKLHLLTRQMECFADQRNYTASIQAGEQLKSIYEVRNDELGIQNTERFIKNIQDTEKQGTSAPDASTDERLKQIDLTIAQLQSIKEKLKNDKAKQDKIDTQIKQLSEAKSSLQQSGGAN